MYDPLKLTVHDTNFSNGAKYNNRRALLYADVDHPIHSSFRSEMKSVILKSLQKARAQYETPTALSSREGFLPSENGIVLPDFLREEALVEDILSIIGAYHTQRKRAMTLKTRAHPSPSRPKQRTLDLGAQGQKTLCVLTGNITPSRHTKDNRPKPTEPDIIDILGDKNRQIQFPGSGSSFSSVTTVVDRVKRC